MPEVDRVAASLVQTQALERVQETARRQGEMQQQSFGASLNHQVDAREHQVNQGDEAQQEALDHEEKKERREPGTEKSPEPVAEAEGATDGEENLGQHVDARA